MIYRNRSSLWFLAAASMLLTQGCRMDQGKAERSAAGSYSNPIVLKHALGFSMQKAKSITVVRVHKPWQGASQNFTYYLRPAGEQLEVGSKASMDGVTAGADLVIPIPVQKAVTLTTANLHHFESLGLLASLVGVGGGRYVCNQGVISGLREGRIREVGADGQVDVETVVGLKPDLVFTYVVGNSADGGLAKLKEASLRAVIDGSYMEETPLGRAEWIKFTAAFFGKGAKADSIYAEIDSSYSALTALVRQVKRRPTVFVNAPFGGIWWMPGGRSYVARFLADAGADYLWAADTTRGSLNLDLESVLARAGHADFWLNPGDWKSLGDGRSQDPRNAYFQAFQVGRIFNNDRILSAAGGNDFFETGPSRPDWILADLISIFHPELLPNHIPHWYRKLEAT